MKTKIEAQLDHIDDLMQKQSGLLNELRFWAELEKQGLIHEDVGSFVYSPSIDKRRTSEKILGPVVNIACLKDGTRREIKPILIPRSWK